MSDLSTKIVSIRKLAQKVGKSHTAVRSWLKHDEWPFRRTPPWDLADVPTIREWAADTLHEDPAAKYANAESNPFAGFHRMWPRREPWLIPRHKRLAPLPSHTPRDLPPELVTPFELAVITGKRVLPPEEVAEYVRGTTSLKVIIADDIDWLASWLRRAREEDCAAMLRAYLYGRLDFHASIGELAADRLDGVTRDSETGEVVSRTRKRIPAPDPLRFT